MGRTSSNSDCLLCVITARGGSKRIPRKNVRSFCGQPIISYSIKAALESSIFDEVMVSTDDERIVSLALSNGANVPFIRSSKTSDDYATTTDVLLEVLEQYAERGRQFECVCCIYPTAPFVSARVLQRAWNLFRDSGKDMLQPVVGFEFPPQRAFIERDGGLEYWMSECADTRSQDLPTLYHDAGQFYFYKASSIKNPLRTRCPMLLDRRFVQDIDTEDDWLLAETKYRLLQEGWEL